MKKIKTIHLEIDSDKEAEFYFSLLQYKLSNIPDIEALKKIGDAIHLDHDSLTDAFIPTKLQTQKINDKLLSLHHNLLKAKKDSNDYFNVSKNNFEEFIISPFITDLYEFFKFRELSKKWIGKEESAEVKAGIALLSYGLVLLGKCFAQGLCTGLNAAMSIKKIQEESFKVTANNKGGLYCTLGEQEVMDYEVFIEKNGQMIKTYITSKNIDKIFDLDKTKSVFLKIENQAIEMKQSGDNVEIRNYENIEEKNQKLDLSKAEIIRTMSVPKDQLERSIKTTEEGRFIYQPTGLSSVNIGLSLTFDIENESISNDLLRVQEKKDTKTDLTIFASLFNPHAELISTFLKIRKGKWEETEARNKIILNIYSLLTGHYPDITPHISATITGYICSSFGLLKTEIEHDESNKRQTYRKYLKDTVYNIVNTL